MEKEIELRIGMEIWQLVRVIFDCAGCQILYSLQRGRRQRIYSFDVSENKGFTDAWSQRPIPQHVKRGNSVENHILCYYEELQNLIDQIGYRSFPMLFHMDQGHTVQN